MPRKKVRTAKDDRREYFFFEVKSWRPSFSTSVNHDKYRKTAFRDRMAIELDTVCIFPKRLVGRAVECSIVGERDWLTPIDYRLDPKWMPLGIGMLELFPDRGQFYTSVAHESMPTLLSGFAHGGFRYVSLWGPPLKRNQTVCLEFRLLDSVNLEEY